MAPQEMPLIDIIGAFGDISWAAHVPAPTADDGIVTEVLALVTDHELVLHRLLLSGYTKERDIDTGTSLWRSPGGALLRVIETDAEWGRMALGAASRNRDRRGAPHLTLPYVIFECLTRDESAKAEVETLMAGATEAELTELRALIKRFPPNAPSPEREPYDATERG